MYSDVCKEQTGSTQKLCLHSAAISIYLHKTMKLLINVHVTLWSVVTFSNLVKTALCVVDTGSHSIVCYTNSSGRVRKNTFKHLFAQTTVPNNASELSRLLCWNRKEVYFWWSYMLQSWACSPNQRKPAGIIRLQRIPFLRPTGNPFDTLIAFSSRLYPFIFFLDNHKIFWLFKVFFFKEPNRGCGFQYFQPYKH